MIRVLVVDDSATARALVGSILNADPEIQVVGEARHGVEAVAMTQTLQPDLVVMDLHMPGLDGLEATKEIMITAPTPIVIITGSIRVHEVKESMDTLRIGALDVLLKPPGPESPGFAEAARHLVTTVKSMAQVKVVRHWRPTAASATTTTTTAAARPDTKPGRVVGIAASTGGPAALQRLLSDLPATFPLPVLVVQHITPGFTAGLAAWLNSVCPQRVKVAEQGERLAAHTVYIAPDNRHLSLAGPDTVALTDGPPLAGLRPSGTVLFQAIARTFGAAALAVILTGMGEDGIEGLRAIRHAGGYVIAQDETTAVVFGMPAAAIAAGLADSVLPIEAIAARLVALADGPSSRPR